LTQPTFQKYFSAEIFSLPTKATFPFSQISPNPHAPPERTPAYSYGALVPPPPKFGGLGVEGLMWITELKASGAKKYDTKSLKIGLSSENLSVLCHWEVARGKFGHIDSIHPTFWPKSIIFQC
jgi:hypothetical protein